MTAPVISLAAHRLKQAAIRKGERVRELAECFAQYLTEDERMLIACYYIDRGWAQADEVRLAMKELEA